MKHVLTYEDPKAGDRNSYGCFLMVDDRARDGAVVFFCSEWQLLWNRAEDAGGNARSCAPTKRGELAALRPATLAEIRAAGLEAYVTRVLAFAGPDLLRADGSMSLEEYVRRAASG